jgi:hypothetical protein
MAKKCFITIILFLGYTLSVYSEGVAEVIVPLIQLGAMLYEAAEGSSNSSSSSDSSSYYGSSSASSSNDFHYYISTGNFVFPDGTSAYGYAGDNNYKNNPDATGVSHQGPLPVGTYRMTGYAQTLNGETHPNVIHLDFYSGDMKNRDNNFRIHGGYRNGSNASSGCIILSPSDRQKIARILDSGGSSFLYVHR